MGLCLKYGVISVVASVMGLLALLLLPFQGGPTRAESSPQSTTVVTSQVTDASMTRTPAMIQAPVPGNPGTTSASSDPRLMRIDAADRVSDWGYGPAMVNSDAGAERAACQVVSAKKIADGGDQSWLAAGDLIAFDQPDKNGIYQLYTIRPDGTDQTCLSCTARPGGPSLNQHKFNPTWEPSGQWIVAQVEIANNPISWMNRIPLISELLLNGVWNDLYAISPDGATWVKLTSTKMPQTDGVLLPRFSRDGTKLIWSHLIEEASYLHPWGVWRIQLADFVVQNGVPSLQNVQDITPEGGSFFEANGFSPDGGTVMFTGDLLSKGKWDPDIWIMPLDTRVPTVLTRNGFWNEHASYSPSGNKIEYMSSQPYPSAALKTELILMNPDGSDKFQLTHFNEAGYPEYDPNKSMPITSAWNADGTQLAVTQQMADTYPARRMWVLTFAGPCGG